MDVKQHLINLRFNKPISTTHHTHTHTHTHTRTSGVSVDVKQHFNQLQLHTHTHTHTHTHARTHAHTHADTVSVKDTTLTKRVPRERFQSDPARFARPDISHVTTNRDRTNRCLLNKPPMTRSGVKCWSWQQAPRMHELKAKIMACIYIYI